MRWNADTEIRGSLAGINQPSLKSPEVGNFTKKGRRVLLGFNFDKDGMRSSACLTNGRTN